MLQEHRKYQRFFFQRRKHAPEYIVFDVEEYTGSNNNIIIVCVCICALPVLVSLRADPAAERREYVAFYRHECRKFHLYGDDMIRLILRKLQKLALKALVFAHNWRQDVRNTIGRTTLHLETVKCETVPVVQCDISHGAMGQPLCVFVSYTICFTHDW